jgi:hypothetical protein
MSIKIEVNNIEDFKKQYYNKLNANTAHEILIELKTDDKFWEFLISDELEHLKDILAMQYPSQDVSTIESKNIKSIYLPKYGNIKRL